MRDGDTKNWQTETDRETERDRRTDRGTQGTDTNKDRQGTSTWDLDIDRDIQTNKEDTQRGTNAQTNRGTKRVDTSTSSQLLCVMVESISTTLSWEYDAYHGMVYPHIGIMWSNCFIQKTLGLCVVAADKYCLTFELLVKACVCIWKSGLFICFISF